MCSGALINPKHDTPLYFETYRSQNKLHIPMRIDTPYQLENYILSMNTYKIKRNTIILYLGMNCCFMDQKVYTD